MTAGILLALVVVVLMIPPWWHNPVAGLEQFFRSNFTRASTTPLKTLFLGEIYETPTGSLPWYNTIVWSVFVTPVGFLIFGALGIFTVLAHPRVHPAGVLFLIHWLFLMVLRSLPHTPGHDAVRQFLPALGMWALLAGLGAHFIGRRPGKRGQALIAFAIVEGAVSVGMMMPVPLSYFSPLVGGLPGATAAGMEPTFYWDSLQPEMLEWLNTHTRPDQKVLFARYPTSLLYLRQTHRLKVKILPTESGPWAWYVVQNRPGGLRKMDRDLIAGSQPAAVYRKLGVPLLWVFPYHDVELWQAKGPAASLSAD